MTLENLFLELESPKFAAAVGLASDLGCFLKIAQSDPIVMKLSSLAALSSSGEVVERLNELVSRPYDGPFRRPWDSAAAILLWICARENPMVAQLFALQIDSDQSGKWRWARQIARKILNQRTSAGISSVPASAPNPNRQQTKTTRGFLVIPYNFTQNNSSSRTRREMA